MQCEEVRQHITDYVTHRVGEPHQSQIGLHLATCDSCRAEFEDAEELRRFWSTTLAALPVSAPDPEARIRFDYMLGAYQEGRRASAPRSAWRPALQLAFGAGLLALGIGLGYEIRPAQTPPDPERTREIAQLRDELAGTKQMVAVSLMQQQSASERLRGVNWSYEFRDPGQEILSALLEALMHDPSVNVRLATIDALRQFGDRPFVRKGVLDALARQESPMVQVALIDLAVDLREKESVATLRALSQDQEVDEAVRERAQTGLAALE